MIVQLGLGPPAVLLDQYPGQLVVAICVRAKWEHEEKVGDQTGCGEEGIWYRDPDYSSVTKLAPFLKEDHQWLYDIQVPSLAKQHMLSEHRFLVKCWDMDVYLPTLKTTRFSVVEYVNEDDESHWEIRGIGMTLAGFTFGKG